MSAIRILSRKDVRQWLEGVRYPVDWAVSSWSTSIGSQIRHALHERAAAFYARKHFEEHGRLPEGTHRVVARIGPDIRIDGWSTNLYQGCLETDITYPPDPPRVEREGSGSAPARPQPGHPTPSSRFQVP